MRHALSDGDVVAGQLRCSVGPTTSTGSSSQAINGEGRSGTRPRTWRSSLTSPARLRIYAGAALGHRAAYRSARGRLRRTERRIEPFLLDFDGDLYGRRLVVEIWQRLRDEAVFASEEELIAQIGRDVDADPCLRPATARLTLTPGAGDRPRSRSASGLTTPLGSPASNELTWANASRKYPSYVSQVT